MAIQWFDLPEKSGQALQDHIFFEKLIMVHQIFFSPDHKFGQPQWIAPYGNAGVLKSDDTTPTATAVDI